MLKKVYRLALIAGVIAGLVVIAIMLNAPHSASAAAPALAGAMPALQSAPPGPDRFTAITVDYTLYEWWMAAWFDNNIYCSFYVDHDGLPTEGDVYSACSEDVYVEWKAYSQPCYKEDITECPGYYLIPISSKPAVKEIVVKLAPADVRISLEGCQPDAEGWCTQQPNLVLKALEPLPNEKILSIQGMAGNDPYSCEGDTCIFKLSQTSANGVRLKFWAYSSYGDSSEVFDALLRVVYEAPDDKRLTPRWYVDVLSSQWAGVPVASCAAIWEAFPPAEGLPQWLSTPEESAGLKSSISYAYLAANLISQGVTDASDCPGQGLFTDGSANACGLEKARTDVLDWQNRFDSLIFAAAQEGDVPAQLLKNLFSRESQFWPGAIRNGVDVGLGQMTENGADTTFLWNPSFYQQFCPLVLENDVCKSTGFAELQPHEQALLRGALLASVDARCEDCPLRMDLARADFSVSIFAHSLLANCEQAGRIVQNVAKDVPGRLLDYETLWRFTLVNYNAGPGCLSDAVLKSYNQTASVPLSWEGVAAELKINCPGAVEYVEDISREIDALAEPDNLQGPSN